MAAQLALAFVLLGLVLAAGGAELAFDISIDNGRVSDSMRFVRVKQGDVVTLRWSTDRVVTIHLHGYDIERRIEPGETVEMRFEARATGRFPVHLHAEGAKTARPAREEPPLVYIEVYPRE